ncbi:group III truncated hemoglobin [Pyruvatibacter mobilis]|uniref:group III truncated hemoglobin n=1 Tax=Pyruvatibacter mobilis TaxID=1712261 RepID=UPI003C79F18F
MTRPVLETHIRSAAERRADIEAKARQLGIDDAFVDRLVETFYGRIREDATLGPIFNNAISDWDPHLATMKDFWASVAYNAGRYSGRPVPAHLKHKAIRKEHFAVWLGLFREVLEEISPSPLTVAYFMERAERIAQSLQLAMFGLPGLGEKSPAPRQ